MKSSKRTWARSCEIKELKESANKQEQQEVALAQFNYNEKERIRNGWASARHQQHSRLPSAMRSVHHISPVAWTFLCLSAVRSQGRDWDNYCRYHNGATSTCMVVLDGEMKCTPAGPPCGKGDIPPVANPGYVAREATTTTTSTPSTGLNINQIRGDCDRYCQVMNNDEDSYCKWWLEYAVCIGGDQPCGTQSLCELPNKSISPGGPEGDGLYYGECDLMCQSMNNDEGSFCKWWLDVPVCKHGNQACGDVERCRSQDWPKPQGPPTAVNEVTGHPHHSAPCDSFCQSLNDDGSYCKWWKTEPVCRGGDQPCGPSYCSTGEPPGTGTPQDRHSGPDVNCDAYCEDQSPPPTDGESYCKWWLHVPVCKGGDQLCGPSICTEYSPSAP